jgi:hypothetical protein
LALPTVPRQLKTPEMPTGRKCGSFCTPKFASRQSARVLNSPSVMISGSSAFPNSALLFDLQLAVRIRFEIGMVAS